jgi:threonine dehydratase
MLNPPTLADIKSAQTRIKGAISETPCIQSHTLSAITGCDLFFKFENMQFTASFKERGALNRLLTMSQAERARGVCAMSAGNHAQGLAYHANRLGAPATIFMPVDTPFTKVTRTRSHNARVELVGANLSEALEVALDWARSSGQIFVHPFDDPDVIAGQGTIALEILAQMPAPDVMLVPIGGGGLISGIATAIKALSPSTKVIGVQSRAYPSMVQTLAGNDLPCADALTIAEGIAVKTAGRLTREIVRGIVDDILLVEEASIEQAIALLLDIEKTVVEGAGAAGLAAIIEHPGIFADRRVVTPLCGGNIDLRILSSVALRSLVRSGTLCRLTVSVGDRPGSLAKLTTTISEQGANVIEVNHDRLSLSLNAKATVLVMMIELADATSGDRLISALADAGFDASIGEQS